MSDVILESAVLEETLALRTRDGVCPTHVFRPAMRAQLPVVVLYMDGPGIRSSLFAIARRVASNGYFVALPDLFYRLGGADPEEQKRIFSDPDERRAWIAKYLPSASLMNVREDTRALLELIAAREDVKPLCIGVAGFCMGGGHALTAAGLHPDRVRAAVSFHGGALATEAPESPHRLAPQMRARVYVAAASNDPLFPDDMKARLDDALRDARVDYRLETYEGAFHGWVPSDTPAHHPEAAERALSEMLALFDATLRG